eukprot:3186024-Pleurochrysis_carterae.AAC.1
MTPACKPLRGVASHAMVHTSDSRRQAKILMEELFAYERAASRQGGQRKPSRASRLFFWRSKTSAIPNAFHDETPDKVVTPFSSASL